MEYTEQQLKDMTRLFKFHNVDKNFRFIMLKTIEELNSLSKVLAKLLLGEYEPHDIELLDEMFDADFMIFQIKRILVPDEYMQTIYNNVVDAKLERELKRWGLT